MWLNWGCDKIFFGENWGSIQVLDKKDFNIILIQINFVSQKHLFHNSRSKIFLFQNVLCPKKFRP